MKMDKVVLKVKPHFGAMRPLDPAAKKDDKDAKKDDKDAKKDDGKKPALILPGAKGKDKDDAKKPQPKITLKPKK